jgi:hypothetical protein
MAVEHLYDCGVVTGLLDAINNIDWDHAGLGDVDELRAAGDLFNARFTDLIARLDAEGAYGVDGAVSMQAWLKQKANLPGASASKTVRTGRKLRRLDAVRDAWQSGLLSAGHVEVIVANVKERHVGLFAEHQHDIVKRLAEMTVEQAHKVMRWWSLLAEDLIPGPDNDDPPDSLHLSRTLGDRGILKGSFSPEVTAIIEAALKLIAVDDPDTPAEQRRAEALAMICQYVLDHHDKPKTRRNRPHIAVIMREGPDGNPVAETLEGVPGHPQPLAAVALRRTRRPGHDRRIPDPRLRPVDADGPYRTVASRRPTRPRLPLGLRPPHRLVRSPPRQPVPRRAHLTREPRPVLLHPPPQVARRQRLDRSPAPRRPTRHHIAYRHRDHDLPARTHPHPLATRRQE